MTDLIAGEIIAILMLAVGVATLLACTPPRHKAPVEIEPAVDEDITRPSLAVIEAALIRTTDPGGRDHLLDLWISEKERASS